MTLVKRPGSPFFYARFMIKGVPYMLSTGTANRDEAEKQQSILKDKMKAQTGNPVKRQLTPTLTVVGDMDIERARGEGKTASYINNGISLHWKWLSGFFEDTKAVTTESLRAYVTSRVKAGRRGQTIKKELTTLKRGLKLGQAAGYAVEVPALWPKISDSDPDEKQEGRLVSRKGLRAFLEELEGEARDLALLAVLTGLRRAELYRIQPGWVREYEGEAIPAVLRLPGHGTKGRKKREVGLVPAAMAIAKRAPFKEEHKGAFRFASRRAKEWPRVVHLRDLRHTFATMAADITGDELGVAMVLGHVSGLMTLRYQTMNVARLAKIALAVAKWLDPEL